MAEVSGGEGNVAREGFPVEVWLETRITMGTLVFQFFGTLVVCERCWIQDWGQTLAASTRNLGRNLLSWG